MTRAIRQYELRLTLIEHHFEEAAKIAVGLVRELARKILKENDELDEFVGAMGGIIFTLKDPNNEFGDRNLHLEDRPYFKPLMDLINLWDDCFGLTGIPMRFTAKGKEINNW